MLVRLASAHCKCMMRLLVLLSACMVLVCVRSAATILEDVAEQQGTSLFQRLPPTGHLPYNHSDLQPRNQFVEQVHITAAGNNHIAINWVTPREPDGAVKRKSLHRKVQPHQEDQDDCTAARIQSLVQVFSSTADNKQTLTHTVKGSYTCYSTPSYQSGLLHLAIVGPLDPEKIYSFKCGDPSYGWSEEYSFKTLPAVSASSLPFRLAVVGDLGQTKHSRSTLQHLQDSQPGLVIDVGDLSYADGEQPRWDSFSRLIEPFFATVPHMTIEGNHEIESYNHATLKGVPFGDKDLLYQPSDSPVPFDKHFLAYETRFYVPASESRSDSRLYYSFEVAGAHVIMLGCYTDFSKASYQYEWLKNDLEQVDRSKTPWLFVGMHAPWYNSNTAHQQEMAVMRHNMEHLLHKHRVDIVFSGHVHSYERTHRVYKEKHHHCAPFHVIIGDGGNREGLARDWEFPQPHWSAFRESSYGHGTLDMFNETHALWRWVRNHDHTAQPADSKWIVRDIDGCMKENGLERDWAKEEEEEEAEEAAAKVQ